ncbi:MAG: hypothetical protein ACRD1C_02980 [Terriglobales bacterium]
MKTNLLNPRVQAPALLATGVPFAQAHQAVGRMVAAARDLVRY